MAPRLVRDALSDGMTHAVELLDTIVSRGTIVSRTYGTHKNLYLVYIFNLFMLTIFGPIYYTDALYDTSMNEHISFFYGGDVLFPGPLPTCR